jgi:hypothetical protein
VRQVRGVVLQGAGEALGGGPEGRAVAGDGILREGEGELLHTVGEVVLEPDVRVETRNVRIGLEGRAVTASLG